MRLTLSRKATILVAIPLVFEIVFVAVLVNMMQQVERERIHEAHAHDVAAAANRLLQALLNTGTTSVVYHVTGSKAFKERFRAGNDEIRKDALRLRDLVQDHPAERKSFEKINKEWLRFMDAIWNANVEFEKGNRIAAVKVYASMQKDMDSLFAAANSLVKEQQEIQAQKRREQAETRKAIMTWIGAGLFLNVFIAVALLLYFNQGTSRRLTILMDNLRRLAANQPLNYPITGSDEIALVDQTLRSMAVQLAEARRKEQAVIDNAVDVICSLDRDGRFVAVNLAAYAVWGHDPDALLGTRLINLVVEEDREHTIARIEEITQAGTTGSFDNRIKTHDGSLKDMQWSVHWSEAEKALFCVVHDISERKRMDQLKRDFLAMVSHDLRTPLSSLSAFLELLNSGAYGKLNKEGLHSLSITEVSVERLINLVNALLDIDKMESGALELHMSDVPIKSLIVKSIASVEGFAKQQEVAIEVKAQDDLDVLADGDRIVQVIVNLLSNAVKFSPKNAKVTVASRLMEDYIEISIEDIGLGVPASMREVIFDRYRQVDISDERQRGGSGLGLAICKAIVERHGGKIGVDSDGVSGSRFWFTLPKKMGTA